eukprot:4676164-Amphidinium_carterae.1
MPRNFFVMRLVRSRQKIELRRCGHIAAPLSLGRMHCLRQQSGTPAIDSTHCAGLVDRRCVWLKRFKV